MDDGLLSGNKKALIDLAPAGPRGGVFRRLHWASREIKYRGWSVVTVSQSWTCSEREGTFRCGLNLPYHFFRWGQFQFP